jgi:type IV pilus assembly protein PilC
MTFSYKAVTNTGESKEGTIDAVNNDSAISALQRRGFIVVSVTEVTSKTSGLKMVIFEHVAQKEVVILSRQISTLFQAQVSPLKAFSLMATNTDNPLLARKLATVVDDLQAGFSISNALAKHADVFSDFYVNMVKAGEETGKLDQSFAFLADYLDRQYALTSKTRNALIYPAFVIFTFLTVMVLMLTLVIPKLSQIILESGQDIPIYTRIVIGVSNFVVNYGVFILIFVIIAGAFIWSRSRSESGKRYLDGVKIGLPVLGELYKKLYLSRIADNMDTMISSGIQIERALEITGKVVGNRVYQQVLEDTQEGVKAGTSISDSFSKYDVIPHVMSQMIRVGEETGSTATILKTLAKFYKREVDDAVDTLIGLIEPIMIVMLGLGVGVLLTSVLVPIYNIASSIN